MLLAITEQAVYRPDAIGYKVVWLKKIEVLESVLAAAPP